VFASETHEDDGDDEKGYPAVFIVEVNGFIAQEGGDE